MLDDVQDQMRVLVSEVCAAEFEQTVVEFILLEVRGQLGVSHEVTRLGDRHLRIGQWLADVACRERVGESFFQGDAVHLVVMACESFEMLACLVDVAVKRLV